jgi:hypothetical protein
VVELEAVVQVPTVEVLEQQELQTLEVAVEDLVIQELMVELVVQES